MNELPLAKKSKLKRDDNPIVSPLSPTAVAALAATNTTSPRAQSAISARKPGVGAHLEPLFHHTALPPTAPITANTAATARLTRRVSSGDKDSLMSLPSPSETITSWMNTNAPNIITEWLNHHTDTIIRAAVNQLLTTTSTSTQPNLQQQILTQLQTLVASQAQNKAFHKVSKHGNTRKPSIDNLSSSGVSSAGDDDDVEVKGSDDEDQDDDVDDDDADMSTSETSNIHMGFKSRTSIHSNTSQEDGVDFPNVEDPRDAIKKKMMKKFDTHDVESQPIRTPAFPQKKSPQPQATRRPVGMAGAKSSGGSGGFDLLLVEDVRVSQRIAHHALTRAHYKVDVASDGETAVEKFKQHMSSLRIVLMDINLPGISGIEATEQIRKHERDHRVTNPVLVFGLTGNVDEDSLRSYEQVGMNGCILKGKLLVESVREAVDAASRSSEFVNLCGEGNKRRAGYTSGSENDSGDDRGSPQQPKRAIPLTQQIAMKQTQQKIKPEYDTKQSTEAIPMEDTTSTPAAAPKRATPTSTSAIPVHIPGSTSGPDVLLVEDVRVSQRIAHQALTRAHYKVEVASDGETAVEKFRTFQSTLRIILMDINLPGISGIEATEQIRKMERAAGVTNPVLVFGLTGNVDQDNLRTYEEVGMNGCILKGKLLVDAVKQATLEYSKTPGTFVDLASKPHEIPKTEAPKPKKKLGLGLRSAGAAQASLIQQATPPTSTTTTTTSTSPEEDADDDEEMVVERDEAAKLEAQSKREAELSGRIAATRAQALKREGQGVAIGTPRASQPRQLLASKFAGAGKVKPGVGLPSATTTTTTSSTSNERPLGLQRGSTKSSNGPDCLLVEDVRVSQRIAQQALTRAHYKVDVASDGETSVEKFKQHMDTLRIVLMDINLPGISGIEATERIRKHERDQKVTNPVLVFGLTGNVDEDSLRSYEQVGMNGCILKGKLLVDSVKKATEEAARNPTKFVNLVGDSDPSASP